MSLQEVLGQVLGVAGMITGILLLAAVSILIVLGMVVAVGAAIKAWRR